MLPIDEWLEIDDDPIRDLNCTFERKIGKPLLGAKMGGKTAVDVTYYRELLSSTSLLPLPSLIHEHWFMTQGNKLHRAFIFHLITSYRYQYQYESIQFVFVCRETSNWTHAMRLYCLSIAVLLNCGLLLRCRVIFRTCIVMMNTFWMNVVRLQFGIYNRIQNTDCIVFISICLNPLIATDARLFMASKAKSNEIHWNFHLVLISYRVIHKNPFSRGILN